MVQQVFTRRAVFFQLNIERCFVLFCFFTFLRIYLKRLFFFTCILFFLAVLPNLPPGTEVVNSKVKMLDSKPMLSLITYQLPSYTIFVNHPLFYFTYLKAELKTEKK